MRHSSLRILLIMLSLCLIPPSFGATKARKRAKSTPVVAKPATKPPNAAKALRKRKTPKYKKTSGTALLPGASHISNGPWLEPTFADSTVGDVIDGEDLTVRRAAVAALGPYNGSVVVADPSTGRVLTIVNQKTAFRPGYQPCSTIKIVAAMAGLSEGVIDRDTN